MKYSVNDTVLYGSAGVCRIAEVSAKSFYGDTKEYYVLKPVNDEKSTIFVPTGSEELGRKMRRVLSAGEICDLIKAMPQQNTIWIDDEKQRKEQYKKILHGGDRAELVRLIKTLYLHQQAQKENGRRMHAADEQFMKEAEQKLYCEFAHVLNINREQVLPFIIGNI